MATTSTSSTAELPKEASFYWIHCNLCFEIYVRTQCQVFLLACKHISCENCMKSTEDKNLYVCPMCNKTVCVRLLGNALPPHIKELFHPEPWQDSLPTMQILRFQQKHTLNFEQGMNNRSRAFSILQQRNEEAWAAVKANFVVLKNKRHERKLLEQKMRRVFEMVREMERRNVPRASPSSINDESGIGTESELSE